MSCNDLNINFTSSNSNVVGPTKKDMLIMNTSIMPNEALSIKITYIKEKIDSFNNRKVIYI